MTTAWPLKRSRSLSSECLPAHGAGARRRGLEPLGRLGRAGADQARARRRAQALPGGHGPQRGQQLLGGAHRVPRRRRREDDGAGGLQHRRVRGAPGQAGLGARQLPPRGLAGPGRPQGQGRGHARRRSHRRPRRAHPQADDQARHGRGRRGDRARRERGSARRSSARRRRSIPGRTPSSPRSAARRPRTIRW